MELRFFIPAIVLVVSYLCIRKNYKKCETFSEQIIFVLIVSIVAFPILMYYLDKFNIATIFKYSDDVNQEVWLELLFNYGALIISQIISAVVLFFITRMQIDEARKENEERTKEEHRINNMPLLEYSFPKGHVAKSYLLDTKFRKGNTHCLTICINNIGETAIRKCIISISGDIIKKDYNFKLSEQSCISSKEKKYIGFVLNLKEGIYNANIKVFYQDIIHNWYSQEIKIVYKTDNNYDSTQSLFPTSVSKCEILDENLINEEPNFIYNN